MNAGLALAGAWVLGVAWQLQSTQLPSVQACALLVALAGVLCAAGTLLQRGPRLACWVLAVVTLAWGSTAWRAQGLLQAHAWVPEEPTVLTWGIQVSDLPVRQSGRWRFDGEVVSDGVEHRVRVAAPEAAMPGLAPGQVWRVAVRVKPLDGLYNPGGWDPTRALFARGVQAQATVLAEPMPRLLRQEHGGVDARRLAIRTAIEQRVDDPADAGVLAGLSVGDQSAIHLEDWQIFQRAGVAHLVSISGPHVLMVGWLAGWLLRRAWSRSARLCRWWPAPLAAAWMAVAVAGGYALLAGWGIPAQRTVWMLAGVALLRTAGVQWPWTLKWALVGVVVLVADPWALWQPSFWLSFVAVGVMTLLPRPSPARPSRTLVANAWRELWGVQWRLTMALAPLTLLCFQSVSVVGLAANLVAIPWVSALIAPLSLLGVALPPAWDVAAWAVSVLRALLAWGSAPGWALWSVPLFPFWLGVWALVLAPLAIMKLPRALRWWVWPPVLAVCCLPPSWRTLAPPPQGEWSMVAADVGQGTAVVIQTAAHTLLFDAGVRYPSGQGMGERVVLPLLKALGVGRLDRLVISHDDLDHHGGVPAVLQSLPVRALNTSLTPTHALLQHADITGQVPAHEPCLAGAGWEWDGVQFEWLHPQEQGADLRDKDNARSCVLLVRGRSGAGRSTLLTGDIEAAQEAALVHRWGAEGLRADVLLVPHHGSKTSSTPEFLYTVQPTEAVVQAGRDNRYGHPHPQVMQRLQALAERVVTSPSCGAYLRRSDEAQGRCWRQRDLAYWHPDRLRAERQALTLQPTARP